MTADFTIKLIMEPTVFSEILLTWYDRYGRKNLPWQKKTTIYRVWLSEIMLQQTQVNTVLSYFNKFVTKFPTIIKLASAPRDHVLSFWSGLGYYSRARNLHESAKIIMEKYGGIFPTEIDLLEELPGIGRSTAGAILSLSLNKAVAILDGNVKRVLSRTHLIGGDLEKTVIKKALWELIETYLSKHRAGNFNQAMMDLGATICTRSKPNCDCCPLQRDCLAFKFQRQADYPEKKIKKTKAIKTMTLLLLTDENNEHLLLMERPLMGIWGGLWSFPECPEKESEILAWAHKKLGVKILLKERWETFSHSFTHIDLRITPILARIKKIPQKRTPISSILWYKVQEGASVGLSAPVQRLIKMFKEISDDASSVL